MKRILVIIVLLFSSCLIWAQADGIHPGDPGFRQKYADFDFKGRFAVVIEQNSLDNYFLLDFSKLTSRFERVYFLNLGFTSYKIVNLDPVVTEDKICYMANAKYDINELVNLFEELKNKTAQNAATWTEDEKAKWLKDNDKYK